MPTASAATRRPLPMILIRGFGGLSTEDERRIAYQGFNDGSVYPHKQGENYIYEGFILRLIKTDFAYGDATNVVGYFERGGPGAADDDTRPTCRGAAGVFPRRQDRRRSGDDAAAAAGVRDRGEDLLGIPLLRPRRPETSPSTARR